MLGTKPQSDIVERIVGAACERNAPAELHYELRDGALVTARVRLLELRGNRILADRPILLGNDSGIPAGVAITVHVSLRGSRYQFESVIEEEDVKVPLNRRQMVPGIALRRPTKAIQSQRRSHIRVSLVGYDPINVHLVSPHPDVPGACAIDAEVVTGWLVDLSGGGLSVVVDNRAFGFIRCGEVFFVTFALPSVLEDFCVLGSVRHTRHITSSDSLRLGIGFRPWGGRRLTHDQRRICRFVTAHERRMLRRRK